jgi:hypothetical protein
MGCWKFPRGPEAASGEPSAIANWWGRTLGATPLLLVLALERIAAHNSRRPTSEFPSTSPKILYDLETCMVFCLISSSGGCCKRDSSKSSAIERFSQMPRKMGNSFPASVTI